MSEKVCPVCGEKTEYLFEVQGVVSKMVHRMCKCERAKYEAEQERIKRRETELKVAKYREMGFTDEKFRQGTFATDSIKDPKASDFCRAYVRNWEYVRQNNMGLLLWGDVGSGKTFYAACIANALIDKGVLAIMTTLPTLVSSMSRNYGEKREQVLAKVADTPLLILDDVGTERDTSFSNEQVYEIVNQRYKSNKPLIVTTNMSANEMRNPSDIAKKRIYDRILEMCSPLKVSGQSRRQEVAREKMSMMMEEFGLK